jgi:N-carbamoylputrescine amidase
MKRIRVASVQFEHKPNDKNANFEKIESFVDKASLEKVEIIAFPECCITGYWHLRHLSRPEMEALAEPIGTGPSTRRLMALSKQSGMTIGAGLIEISDDRVLYKAYVVAMPDGQWRCHRKMHAFVNANITCGSEYTVFDTPHGWRVGVLICYDVNIIENVRITALRGAEILLAPHQTGGCSSINPNTMGLVDRALWDRRDVDAEAIEQELRGPKGREWLMRWLPSRAHDNGMYLVFSNGVGVDDDEIRTGNAMILDPYGRILAETWRAGDDMVVADLNDALLEECTGRRWIRTRRPELYHELTVRMGFEVDTRTARFDKKGI